MFDTEFVPEGNQYQFRIGPLLATIRRGHHSQPLLMVSLDRRPQLHDDIHHLTAVLPLPGEDFLSHDFRVHLTRVGRQRPIRFKRCTGADLLRFFAAFEQRALERMRQHGERVNLADLSDAGYLVCHTQDDDCREFFASHIPAKGLRNLRKLEGPALELFRRSLCPPTDLDEVPALSRPVQLLSAAMESPGWLGYYPNGFCGNGDPGWYLLRRSFLDHESIRSWFAEYGGPGLMAALDHVHAWFDAVFGDDEDPVPPHNESI